MPNPTQKQRQRPTLKQKKTKTKTKPKPKIKTGAEAEAKSRSRSSTKAVAKAKSTTISTNTETTYSWIGRVLRVYEWSICHLPMVRFHFFFSDFRISRVFLTFWRIGPLILVLVKRVNIPISFNIGFFESAKVDSDSEDHVLYIKFCSKIS